MTLIVVLTLLAYINIQKHLDYVNIFLGKSESIVLG